MIMRAGLWVFAGKLGSQIARLLLVMALSEVMVRFGLGSNS